MASTDITSRLDGRERGGKREAHRREIRVFRVVREIRLSTFMDASTVHQWSYCGFSSSPACDIPDIVSWWGIIARAIVPLRCISGDLRSASEREREIVPWWRRRNVLGRQLRTVRPESHIPGKLSSFAKLNYVNSIILEYLDNNVFGIFIKKVLLLSRI